MDAVKHVNALKQRNRLLAIGVLLLLAVMAGILLVANPWQEDRSDGANSCAADPIAADNRPQVIPQESPADSAAPSPATTVQQPPNDEKPPSPPVVSSSETEVTLQLVDANNRPTPLVKFEYAALGVGEFARLDRENAGDPPVTEARADLQGQWKVVAAKKSILFLRLMDAGWSRIVAESRRRRGVPTGPNMTSFQLSDAAEHSFVLKLSRDEFCRLQIEYADGQPFAGDVRVASFVDATRQTLAGKGFVTLSYEPGLSVSAPTGTWLRIALRSPRGGFREHTVADPEPAEVERGSLTIVVPVDKDRRPPGGLIIDHTALLPDQQLVAVLMDWSGAFSGPTMILKGPGETRTEDFGTPTRTNCVAAGDGVVWSSGLLSIEAGEWKRVVVAPSQGAQLSLLVQDHAGNPLPGAIVSTEDVGHVEWMWPDVGSDDDQPGTPADRMDLLQITRRMNRARANSKGEVVFAAAWPGKRRYLVEAIGYETQYIEADPQPGKKTDLGTVQLARATSMVTVRAKVGDGGDPTKFAVCLIIPFGGMGHARPVPFNSEGVAEIGNVPSGKYQVFVSPVKAGGAGHFKMLELAIGETREVIIDLTRAPGLQED